MQMIFANLLFLLIYKYIFFSPTEVLHHVKEYQSFAEYQEIHFYDFDLL